MDASSPTETELRTAFKESLRAGWNSARRCLLVGLGDEADVDNFFAMPGAEHVGDPQHPVDEEVTRVVEDALHKHFPELRVIGEEIQRGVNLTSYNVAVVDPIDGTTPFRMLGCAWAVVLYLIVRKEAGLKIPIAGLVTSAGIMVALWGEGGVIVEPIDSDSDRDRAATECTARKEGAPLSLACVGAKEKDCENLRLLRDGFRDATLFNIGGNPVVLGVLRGNLDAIVSFKSQTVWDSIYALLIAHAGGVVGATDEDRVFSPAEVTDWFRRPNQDSRKSKSVPPVIAAKDEATYRLVFQGLRS